MEIKTGKYYDQNNSGGWFADVRKYPQKGVEPLQNLWGVWADLLILDESLTFDDIEAIQETKDDWCSCCGERWSDYFGAENCEYYVFKTQEEFDKYVAVNRTPCHYQILSEINVK